MLSPFGSFIALSPKTSGIPTGWLKTDHQDLQLTIFPIRVQVVELNASADGASIAAIPAIPRTIAKGAAVKARAVDACFTKEVLVELALLDICLKLVEEVIPSMH